MQVRRLGQLKRIQDELLEEYKQQRSSAAAGESADSAAADQLCLLGRVSQVVSSDPELGPHLLVILQKFTGTPPSPSDATTMTQVYYPTPGREVSDYSVNEYVRLLSARGAALAGKLA